MTQILNIPGPDLQASEQVRRWIEAPVDFWETCYRDYGDLVSLELGSLGTVILVSDPALVKDIFSLPPDSFEIKSYNEHYRYVMGDRSLLLSDGDMHKRRRKLMMPPFKRDQLLGEYRAVREIASHFVEDWREGETFNPRPTFHDFTFHVILHRLFADLEHETARALIIEYHKLVLDQVGSWGPWQGFRRMQPYIREVLADEIAARRADPGIPGILTHIASGKNEDGSPIDIAEVEDHVFSLFIAGVDTTAISLTWSLYWLSTHHRVQDTLFEELDGAGPDIAVADLLRLPYLDAVFSETRRMFPVVTTPSGRRLLRPARIGDIEFPAGVTLLPCTYLVHHREDLYPDSGKFLPERFLQRQYGSHEFFPSGGGNRTCLGVILSMFEFKIMLTEVVRHWRLDPLDESAMTPVRHGTFLAPPESFTITTTSRPGDR